MQSAVCVSGFLLLLCSTGVTLSPHPTLRFGHEGGNVTFTFNPIFTWMDDYVLYKVGGEGDLLLMMKCSQPERQQPHGYQLKCVKYPFYFEMSKLTMSHSGDYRAEGCRGGNIINHTNYRLTVCAERHETPHRWVTFGGSVELCSVDSPLRHRSSLQLYRYDYKLQNYILVLDTNSSLEPLVEDLKGRLQVDLNTASVTLSGVRESDSEFYCTVWRGAQCQSYSYRKLNVGANIVFAHEGENVTLPCIAKWELPDQVHWDTSIGGDRLIINQTHPQEVMYNQSQPQEVMYMLNGSQTGDYSLIIPSVSLQYINHSSHSFGQYMCIGSETLNVTLLFVCTKLSPLDVMFSPGQSVLWNITEYVNNFWFAYGIQWYRQRVLQPQVLIVDFYSLNSQSSYLYRPPVSLPEDWRGRVTVSTSPSNSSLIISNLTAEDSGVYTWRVYGDGGCSEGSFRLLYLDLEKDLLEDQYDDLLDDPFGVHSPFYRAYASLMGCVLLGLVTAVIWFKLRSRRGEQTSGRQSREGQQSGDEDLYDDVKMAELNTPPSAVSDGAFEHSV